ncbi:HDOD domain-containing protein [Marispirochaeta aestuarii]|uniref:HDOD domain-containing protein n=1 Tax=Marispirochaeta aestuarii TaxID=1963862 RepID=UPI0029C606F3|nr:HDOD domain-containing protein [Marispirochaeta aestuarii]
MSGLPLQWTRPTFYITITNNVHISPAEEERINERLNRSQGFSSVEEAFQTVLDSSEGAGLGIVMLVLMLRKIGLDRKAFSIQGFNGATVARVSIPRHDLVVQHLSDLTGRIRKELQQIPQFPEHILTLQRLIEDPEVAFNRIEHTISMDPGLAAELLRMVNSAAFGIHRRVKTISEAISLMGLKGIRDLITAYGTVKIMVERYGEMEELWNHCYRVAVYASSIARRYSLRKIYEIVYSSSLLHDLGRVLVDFLSPEFFDKLRRFSTEKKIPPEEFECFAIGTHHAEVGALMAEGWEYPEAITETIRHHHTPDACPEEIHGSGPDGLSGKLSRRSGPGKSLRGPAVSGGYESILPAQYGFTAGTAAETQGGVRRAVKSAGLIIQHCQSALLRVD